MAAVGCFCCDGVRDLDGLSRCLDGKRYKFSMAYPALSRFDYIQEQKEAFFPSRGELQYKKMARKKERKSFSPSSIAASLLEASQ